MCFRNVHSFSIVFSFDDIPMLLNYDQRAYLLPAGKGFVEFFGEDRCNYMFEWSTDLACIAPPALCHLSAKGAKYDLSRLIRIGGFSKRSFQNCYSVLKCTYFSYFHLL